MAEQSGVLRQSVILGEFFVFRKEQLVLFQAWKRETNVL